MDSYFTNLWVTIITVTTVGYGDISAITFLGKLVTIAMAISGTFIMALVVSVVSSSFELDPWHQISVVHMQTSRQAQQTVRHALRYFMYKKAFYQLKAQSEDEEEKIKVLNSKFMRLLRKYSGENYSSSKLLEAG